jgi:type I restriction enzyme S subunit
MGFQTVSLGSLIGSAKLVRAGHKQYPILSMTMHNGLVDQSDKFKKRIASTDTSAYKVVRKGQMVVGFPIDEGVLSFQEIYQEAIVSPAYDVWDIKDEKCINRDYLERFLKCPLSLNFYRGKLKSTTARRRTLPKDTFLSLEIPLPPLEEQKRIAAILDQADDIRRKRQHAIDRLNQLGQAIFHEMFGDIDDGSVSVAQLGDLTSKIGSGATPKGGDSAYKAEGIPLVRSMNVRDGKFSSKGLAFIDEHQASKLDNVVVQANDVLLNITGASVARVCLAPAEMAGARVNQHVSIIRLNKALTSEFLEAFLLMPRTKATLLAVAEAGATRQAITKTQIESLAVPLPSQTQQQEFTDRLKMAKQSLGGMIDQASAYEMLFASLQHRAFAGEL